MPRQLPRGGRLPRSRWADEEDDRRPARQAKLGRLAPHRRRHLRPHDPQELLGRGERLHDLLPNRPFLDPRQEIAHHPVVDIGGEEGLPDLAQPGLDLCRGEPPGGTEPLERLGQPLGQRLKH